MLRAKNNEKELRKEKIKKTVLKKDKYKKKKVLYKKTNISIGKVSYIYTQG